MRRASAGVTVISLLLLLVFLSMSADAAAMLVDEDVNDEAYTIKYMPAGSLQTSPDAADIPREQWTVMTAANGSRYDCALGAPKGATAAEARAARAKLIGKPVPGATAKKIHELLGGACTMSGKGWWVYEACWGRQIRQYHQDANDKIETEYALGLGPSHQIKKGATKDLTFGESPLYGMYASAMYFNGTECDLTKEPRETEVRVACPGEDAESPLAMTEISETATCKYLVVIQSLKACEVPQLQKETKRTQQITCYMRGD
jgi:hypothetical protein